MATFKNVFEDLASKIAALRAKTVDRGATEHEAASAHAKANELEAKHGSAQRTFKGAHSAAKNAEMNAREKDMRRAPKWEGLKPGHYVLNPERAPLDGPHPNWAAANRASMNRMSGAGVAHYDGTHWRADESDTDTITHKVRRTSTFFKQRS